jgi:Methyltransferase domain
MDVKVRFPHGVGDCVYFAHALPLYLRRGHRVTVSCAPDKRILFEPCDVEITHENPGYPVVSWDESAPIGALSGRNYAICNKAASNFRRPPMPEIGTPESLWQEFVEVSLDLRAHISTEHWDEARGFLRGLARPVVLLHTVGNAFQNTKSLPPNMTLDLYRELLDTMDGTLVLLDWDNRVPRMANYRVRHLLDDWRWIPIPTLMALIYESDLVIGIDSGPFHAARYTDTPSIGIFPHPYHYPARVTLPRRRQLSIVPRTQTIKWNQKARIAYNIVHCDGETITAKFVATNAVAMLRGPRYLDSAHLAADVQMQQFVLDFERGYGNGLSSYVDRHNSYDRVLRIIKERYRCPLIVESGCIRSDEDWRGAGYSTYLFASYVNRAGGELISVDNSPDHCRFAKEVMAEFPAVQIHCRDSVAFLRGFDRPIDVLQLDSMDTEIPGYADHAAAEMQAALPHLHNESIVIFDDTVYQGKGWRGKGAKAVPLMLDSGWHIIYSGYQTILGRAR